MKNSVILFFVFLFPITTAYSQDSVILYFKNKKLLCPAVNASIDLGTQDPKYSETLSNVGDNKFLYVKSGVSNKLPAETGRLGIHIINNKRYLLREGIWYIEWGTKKVQFGNSGEKEAIPKEYPTAVAPPLFKPKTQKNIRRRRIRRISHLF